jgi:hypothetical protein
MLRVSNLFKILIQLLSVIVAILLAGRELAWFVKVGAHTRIECAEQAIKTLESRGVLRFASDAERGEHFMAVYREVTKSWVDSAWTLPLSTALLLLTLLSLILTVLAMRDASRATKSAL